jgi:hypothetical protein
MLQGETGDWGVVRYRERPQTTIESFMERG